MEWKEDAGGRGTTMPRKLLALAPPPGTVTALIGAAIPLPEYLPGRQHVDIPPLLPDETLRESIAILAAAALMSKLVHVFGVPHDPVGVAVGQCRQSVTASEHQSQQKQASVTCPWPLSVGRMNVANHASLHQ